MMMVDTVDEDDRDDDGDQLLVNDKNTDSELFTYIVTAHKPTAVSITICGHFTSSRRKNLIIAKANRIEIYKLTKDGIEPILEQILYGRIATMELIDLNNVNSASGGNYATNISNKQISGFDFDDDDDDDDDNDDDEDLLQKLVVVTEDKYQLAVLSYDKKTNTIKTISSGDVSDLTGRPVEQGMIGSIDCQSRIIGLHMYDGLMKFIPFDKRGNLLQEFNANLNELKVLDFCFLKNNNSGAETTFDNENVKTNNNTNNNNAAVSSLTRSINRENGGESSAVDGLMMSSMPVIAVLHKDVKDERHVSTYRVNLKDRDLEPGPFEHREVEQGSKKLLPISSSIGGGCLVVGEETICYLNEVSKTQQTTAQTTAMTMDDEGNNNNTMNNASDKRVNFSTSPSSSLIRALSTPSSLMYSSSCLIPSDGTNVLMDRFLIADEDGDLYLLVLSKQHQQEQQGGAAAAGVVDRTTRASTKLAFERLGKTSSAAAISYLDNSVAFIGSAYGDSQLIKLHTEPVNSSPSSSMMMMMTDDDSNIVNDDDDDLPSYVEVLDEFTNLGPIVDFCVMDLERHGQGQLVTCSGVGTSGSLRVVRNGIGIREQAQIPLSGIKGLFSCKRDENTQLLDSYLIVSFIAETRILAINENDELEEAIFPGFDASSQTIECANVSGGSAICQITSKGVFVCDSKSGELVAQWSASNESPITAGSVSDKTIVIATVGGKLLYFSLELDMKEIVEVGAMTFDSEISCVDKTEFANDISICAVGLWSTNVMLVELGQEIKVLHKESLTLDVVPRSTLFCVFEDTTYLLTGLGDGHLITNVVVVSSANNNSLILSDRKSVSLGTQPVTLKLFKSQHSMHVFAGSDRPTIIYSNCKKLVYSNVNLNEVLHVAPFNCDAFPDALALASGEHLTIGAVDDIQKLHIRTVPLYEQPRRIAHQPETQTLAVLTMKDIPGQEEEFFLRLFDDQTFETLAKYPLQPNENDASILSCSFDGDDNTYFIVGTAFAYPHEDPESQRGRILVFKVSSTMTTTNTMTNCGDRNDAATATTTTTKDNTTPSSNGRRSSSSSSSSKSLTLVCEKDTRGAVYNLNSFCGKLLAGINSLVKLFNWVVSKETGKRDLVHECSHMGHIIALKVETKGNLIVVGDLMKSITLLEYKHESGRIEEVAHDFSSNWMTAVEILDDDTYLGAESSYNLFSVKRNKNALTDDLRGTLELSSAFHLGDSVNRFRKGSLVMRMPDQTVEEHSSEISNTWLFGTISGGLGVIATISKKDFDLLNKVQEAMQTTIVGVGNFSHKEFRSFHNVQRNLPMKNFIDGDLIELFLDLSRDEQIKIANQVVQEPEKNYSVDVLAKKIEEISRLTH